MPSGHVSWLHLTPVKSTALHSVDTVWLDLEGARGDRRYLFVDARDHMVNGKRFGALATVRADWHAQTDELVLTLPDGAVAGGPTRLGEPRPITMYGRRRMARPLLGDWSEEVSAWAGRPLQLMQPDPGDGVDRARAGGATLLGAASLGALGDVLGGGPLDPRRFRMLIGVAGIEAYAEDGWVTQRVGVGEAVVLVHGNVGRCAVTTQDPDSGTADLPTLHALQRSRGDIDSTEPLPFGVWGEVVGAGRVAVGDTCEPWAS